ncbi:facilitated trehalose transporter Tret1 [Orussus abietinus]|uniref:facilitated trehalose transporter Tret1 n=1 Tax=Orussus abietinus TaxID=222816 RepID=UPI000625C29B|nr:facilitated trehalose transporter Tret1 [Orussus abietinus]XP_012271536.1 facilitated trehalose transporter Tret1 [Orussus abietinus]
MVEKNIGISQQTLVSSVGDRGAPASKVPQYVAGLASTLGALAAGMVLGWTSPAGKNGVDLAKEYDIPLTITEFSWIGAFAPLGAAAICVPIGILTDVVGRKNAMLGLVVPFTIGWALIIWANSFAMFCIGRFITGLSGGAFCVTAPMYTGEIAQNEIRGSLGSYFQLMLTAGILCSYVLGTVLNMFQLSIVSAVVPLVFFGIFFFMPETPTYYLKKGDEDAARASLVRLRGPRYDVEPELQAQRESLDEAARNAVSVFKAFRSKAAVKGLVVAFGLMLFQQLSGVNAIIFYAGDIFQKAEGTDDPEVADRSAIIVGVMQVVAVFVSTLIVDRLGRRLLLLVSSVAMCLATLVLGVYFYLSSSGQNIDNIRWLPLVSVCGFIILFSLGFGPIPWMMMGELFASNIKGIAGSSACLFNWLIAFIVTKFYSDLENALGAHVTFWIFSGVCALGTAFVFLQVPETKGKTLDEIQIELGAAPPARSSRTNPEGPAKA